MSDKSGIRMHKSIQGMADIKHVPTPNAKSWHCMVCGATHSNKHSAARHWAAKHAATKGIRMHGGSGETYTKKELEALNAE